MTSATERLRALLDERGVEWWEGWDKDLTLFDGANGVRWMADYTLGELFLRSVLSVTPEQAVAATLGSKRLTAEQVREAAELHSREYPSPTDPYVYITEYDWQAIADELSDAIVEVLGNRCGWNQQGVAHAHEVIEKAATLEPGTCEWCADGKFDRQTVMMSNHGWQRINYCPNCGKRVVG